MWSTPHGMPHAVCILLSATGHYWLVFFLVQTTIQRDINLCCRPYNLAIKLPLSVAGEIVAQKKGRRWATIRAESVLWWRRHAINPRFSVKRGDKMKLNCLLFWKSFPYKVKHFWRQIFRKDIWNCVSCIEVTLLTTWLSEIPLK